MERSFIVEFLDLVIEYCSNQNAAGEYDGKDIRLQCLPEDYLIREAKKIKETVHQEAAQQIREKTR